MAAPTDVAAHWDTVYGEKGAGNVSWFQPAPAMSLELIEEVGTERDSAIVDIGAGASPLARSLWDRGYTDLTVVDVSRAALELERAALPEGADVSLIQADIRSWSPERQYDLWHDRAAFHFLTNEPERAGYMRALRAAVRPGGRVILATFAADGPEHCSNLPVARYTAEALLAQLGARFTQLASRREVHHTPWGAAQPFTWLAARRDR